MVYHNSLPVISVRLPSRRERCQFTLKPLSDSVGIFLQQLQAEDRGIDRVAIYSKGMTTHTQMNVFYPFDSLKSVVLSNREKNKIKNACACG